MPRSPQGLVLDPYTAFRFAVESDSVIVGGFSEVSGLQAETEIEDFREGGVNDFTHKFAKLTKYPNLVLKRGITERNELWKWYQDVVNGNIKKANIAVVLMDRDINRSDSWRWEFAQAYPVKWSGSDLNATGSNIFVESVEFAHHGMTSPT